MIISIFKIYNKDTENLLLNQGYILYTKWIKKNLIKFFERYFASPTFYINCQENCRKYPEYILKKGQNSTSGRFSILFLKR